MFCQKCGAPVPEGAKVCPQCRAPVAPARVVVPNYMFLSLLVNCCCCPVCGIPALIASAQVNARAELGDVEGARHCSRVALVWNLVGVGLIVLLTVLCWLSSSAFTQTWNEAFKTLQQMQQTQI